MDPGSSPRTTPLRVMVWLDQTIQALRGWILGPSPSMTCRHPGMAHQECSMRTYSKSTGWLLMPTRGGAIQLAYSPGLWQAFMSELMKS